MFPLTLTLHTPAQLNAVLAALQHEMAATARALSDAGMFSRPNVEPAEEVAAAPEGKPVKAAPARGPRTAEAAAAVAPAKTVVASAPPVASAAAEPQASTAAAEPITYDKVGAAITAKVKVDREKVVAVLKRFGVQSGPGLKAPQYAAFLAALAAEFETEPAA